MTKPKLTYRANPIYVIPEEIRNHNQLLFKSDVADVSDVMPNGDLHIYATSLPPNTVVYDPDDDDHEDLDDGPKLSDFATKYTPTAEEVVRALRGPQGETGPMGAQGLKGESRKCECLEMEDDLSNIPLPDPFMTKEKLYGLPPDKDSPADEPGTMFRAAWIWEEGVIGKTFYGPARNTLKRAQLDGNSGPKDGKTWRVYYEYLPKDSYSWTQFPKGSEEG